MAERLDSTDYSMAQTMDTDGGSVLLAEGTSYNTTTISTSNATDILKDKSVEKLIKKCTCAISEAYYIYDITQLNNTMEISQVLKLPKALDSTL